MATLKNTNEVSKILLEYASFLKANTQAEWEYDYTLNYIINKTCPHKEEDDVIERSRFWERFINKFIHAYGAYDPRKYNYLNRLHRRLYHAIYGI